MAGKKKLCGKPSGCGASSFMDCMLIKDNPEKNHLCSLCKATWPKDIIVKKGRFPQGIMACTSQCCQGVSV